MKISILQKKMVIARLDQSLTFNVSLDTNGKCNFTTQKKLEHQWSKKIALLSTDNKLFLVASF